MYARQARPSNFDSLTFASVPFLSLDDTYVWIIPRLYHLTFTKFKLLFISSDETITDYNPSPSDDEATYYGFKRECDSPSIRK